MRSGASEVYVHGMPGGQYTNLREQARSLGIDDTRWPEVARAYAEVNEMFGDIVKVTPTSKVVGDLALLMVTSGLAPEQVLDPHTQIAFPESVVSLFRGDLGQPYGGFPPALQKKVLKGAQPLKVRPGEVLPPVDLAQAHAELDRKTWRETTEEEFASYLMYPKVFLDYMQARQTYGQVSVLPTPVFFYGLEPGDEVSVDIERGKTLIVRFVAVSDGHDDGTRTVFFELNGQPRSVKVPDRSHVAVKPPRRKADPDQCEPRGRADAGHRRDGAGEPGRPRDARRRAGDDRSDEDGDDGACRPRRDRRRSRDAPGEPIDSKDLLVVLA